VGQKKSEGKEKDIDRMVKKFFKDGDVTGRKGKEVVKRGEQRGFQAKRNG